MQQTAQGDSMGIFRVRSVFDLGGKDGSYRNSNNNYFLHGTCGNHCFCGVGGDGGDSLQDGYFRCVRFRGNDGCGRGDDEGCYSGQCAWSAGQTGLCAGGSDNSAFCLYCTVFSEKCFAGKVWHCV